MRLAGRAHRRRVHQWVTDDIRGRVESGLYRVGQVLDVEQIARWHGVPPVVVWGALGQVRAEGYLVGTVREGITVAAWTRCAGCCWCQGYELRGQPRELGRR